jgi:hypothetical protein
MGPGALGAMEAAQEMCDRLGLWDEFLRAILFW